MHFKLNKDQVNDQEREYKTDRLFIGNKQWLLKIMKQKKIFFSLFFNKNNLIGIFQHDSQQL